MMKMSNKTKSLSLAVVLILTIAATTILALNNANAAATFTTYSILSVDPNPIGIGQTVTLNYQLNFPPLALGLSIYHSMTITVTDPSGVATTYGPSASNPNGGYIVTFVPTTTGNYIIQGSYAGETASNGLIALSSKSPITTLVVQTEPVTGLPYQPIPTDYWTRPINAQNTNWASIAGDWLEPGYNATGSWYSGSSAANPWTQSPLSAHVMWATPFSLGGIVGGESGNAYGNGQVGDWSNLAGGNYATNGWPGVIMNGKVYYNTAFSSSGLPSTVPGMVCRDLRTGQILWQNASAFVSFGTNYAIANVNMYGVQDLVWDAHAAGSWIVYDAFDGSIVHVFANATAAINKPAPVIQPNGEVDFYQFGGAANRTTGGYDVWWAMWNSTRALSNSTGNNNGMTRGTSDWKLGWQWNYTNNEPDNWQGVPSVTYYSSGVFVQCTAPMGGTQDAILQGYSATNGHLIWSHNQTFVGGINSRFAGGQGIYIQLAPSLLTEMAFDVNTGQNVWNTSPLAYPWSQFMTYGTVAFGKYFVGGYSGIEYCFDISKSGSATREPLWQFYVGNTTDTPYGTWPIFNGPIVTQDAVIFANAEHSPNMPLYRGEKMFAVNQTSGALLWNLTGWFSPISVADGYLFASNEYDNRVYSIGKGPTSMTLQAPSTASATGQTLTISGTVMDQSAGQPNTPAISDKDMTAWMEYLYNGMPKPVNAAGVPVSIDAYDPNGNFVHIATVTSDSSGTFSTAFTPDKAGPFRIVASFAGSNSYGSSSAETAMNTVAPTATATATPTNNDAVTNSVMTYTLLAAVAIIIAIALATVLILRKK